jgi:hypothetical protein
LATTADTVVATADRSRLLVVAVPVALAVLLLAESLALPTAWLPLDEAAIAVRARSSGGGLSGPLYPFLLSPFAHVSGAALLEVGRVVGALCWTGLFAPAYALARRGASRPLACAAGAGVVCIPAAVYSAALVPEALGTLLAACALWLGVRASERGSARTLAGAVALGIAATVARPWFAAVPVAVAVAYLLPRVRRPRPFELAVAVAAVYGLYYGLGAASPELAAAVARPWEVLRSALGSTGAAALGAGALPAVLAAARISQRPIGLTLAVAAPMLAFAAGLSGAGRMDERPLLALAPLVFALAVGGLPPARRLIAAAVGIAAAVLFVAWPGKNPTLDRAPGLAFVRGLFGGAGIGPVLAALLVLALAALLLRGGRWPQLALAGVLLALLPGGEIVAWTQARKESRRLAAGLSHPHDWIDRALGGAGRVWVLRTASAASPEAVAELRIWNRSVRGELVADPAGADPLTGDLYVRQAPRDVLALGLEPAGRALGGGLYETTAPLRVAFSVAGVYADGWSGADATYRRFAGTGDTARITVSRKSWGGTDVPGHVSVTAAPLGGGVTARREVVIHAGQELQVEIPVPAPPFELDVRVDPTFSPAKLGVGGDTRQLGAQLAFAYPG